jgi:hypothetical protein
MCVNFESRVNSSVTNSVKGEYMLRENMKINSKIFKGIEYVEVGDLPESQQTKFLQTINRELFIKIMIDKKIIGNCIQYKDYSTWYENLYKAENVVSKPQSVESTKEVVFNKG